MQINRREFLVRSTAGAAGLLLGTPLAAPAEQKYLTFDPYERLPLGKTDIQVTRLGFGTGMRGGMRQSNQTRLGKEKFEALLKAAYERGIRFFDCADLYGTHPYLAQALQKMPRKNYVISTKIWWRPGGLPENQRPNPDVVVRRFLQELNTDYIDLVLLHCVSSPNWPEELGKQMNSLEKLKNKGIIRAHGVSCHSLAALQAAAEEPWVDSVHARVNPYAVKMDVRNINDIPKVEAVLNSLHKKGKAIVAMKIIGEGQFRNSNEKRDRSVSYVLRLGCVDTMIVGFEKVQEIDDLALRVRKVKLPACPLVLNHDFAKENPPTLFNPRKSQNS